MNLVCEYKYVCNDFRTPAYTDLQIQSSNSILSHMVPCRMISRLRHPSIVTVLGFVPGKNISSVCSYVCYAYFFHGPGRKFYIEHKAFMKKSQNELRFRFCLSLLETKMPSIEL